MSSTEQRIQVLYEISLSVGTGEDLTETARNALSAYLQKLSCSAGAVVERRHTQDGSITYQTVTMIPSRAAISEEFEAALARLPETTTDDESFRNSLPITAQPSEGVTYYIMELPGFGVLLLVTRTQPLDSETVAALGPLNEKLATACRGERYEARLREERDRFEAVFATINEPLATVRPENGELVVQRLNPAFEATFGYDEQQALGRSLSSLLGSGPTPEDALPAIDPTDPDDSVTSEIRRETTEGMGEFLFRSAPINPEHDHTEHLALFVDITDEATQKRRLERLYEVTQALSRILRHNIRNDLTVIQARAERILNQADGAAAENARKILEKSEQLTSTAENAREMRELAAKRDHQSPVPLTSAISEALDNVRSNASNAEIIVDADLPDAVTVHPSITTAIRHLVENSIEHYESNRIQTTRVGGSEEGPRVVISAAVHDDEITIQVSDNGPGIPKSEVSVLERPGETDLEHGSGAGLWIVSQIVDHCDASLSFSTDGGGTTVTITLDSE